MWDYMDEPWGHYAKWNKADTKGQILRDSIYMRLLLPPLIHGGRKVGARGCWGEGGGQETES